MTPPNAGSPERALTLSFGRSELSRFNAVLQRGVAVRTRAGRSVFGFLTEEVGLAPEYVWQRITTVFVDGQVVDVLESTILREGALLALSAAMPGLVGATLRRSGPYAAMRSEITRTAEREPCTQAAATIVIRVKLFNLLIDEIGPALLERGVLLEREAVDALGDAARAAAAGRTGAILDLRIHFS
jgi:hypothetical protein